MCVRGRNQIYILRQADRLVLAQFTEAALCPYREFVVECVSIELAERIHINRTVHNIKWIE